MKDPVFRLEGVVRTRSETEDFVGPLSLILQLLSKNKIEIEDISISLILDQYLEYMSQMADMDMDVASEFVAMASHLTYIKSKVLLAGGEEVTELEQLISSLEELRRKDDYVRIKDVTDKLDVMYQRGGTLITKPPEYLAPDHEYKYLHVSSDLFEALMRASQRETEHRGYAVAPPVPVPARIVYSVTGKAGEIVDNLKFSGTLRVNSLFSACASRSEMVATLIALLELCKLGSILLSGDGDDITISHTGAVGDLSLDEYDRGEEL